jgi:hypothetical protein
MQIITPKVQNKTRSFELTRARRNLDIDLAGPELSLRNGYEKHITAFAVSVNGLIVLSDFLLNENEDRRPIAPGAVYTGGFGTVRRSVDRGAAREDFDIKVLAVVFDDRSSDGDWREVAFILEQRLRMKRLLTRVVDLINEDLNSLRTIDDGVFDELRSRISSLSSDPADAGDINDVLRRLDQSDHGLSLNERVSSVKETCENFVSRL